MAQCVWNVFQDAENAGLEKDGLENSAPKCRDGTLGTGKHATFAMVPHFPVPRFQSPHVKFHFCKSRTTCSRTKTEQ